MGTLFAPTTAAFNAIPPAQLAVILTDVQILTQVLNYHVVPATLCSVGLENGEAPTLSGDALTVDVSGAGIFVDGPSGGRRHQRHQRSRSRDRHRAAAPGALPDWRRPGCCCRPGCWQLLPLKHDV